MPAALGAQPQITQWRLPERDFTPSSIAATGSGSAWFANNRFATRASSARSEVDSIDGSGNVIALQVEPFVWSVTRGPGGIWFVREGYVGRVEPDGQLEQFPVATGINDSLSLASGAGGFLWLTKRYDQGRDASQRISRSGIVKTFFLPQRESGPASITRGTDGAMWFTEYFGEKIGRITAGGKLTQFPLGVVPTGGIAAGPEGDLWFETFGEIARLQPASGKVTLFGPREARAAIVAGPDGRIWFAEGRDKVGRITPSGRFSQIDLPGSARAVVTGLSVGPDGSVWYTAQGPSVVGRICPEGPRVRRSRFANLTKQGTATKDGPAYPLVAG